MGDRKIDKDIDQEWEHRVLCSDESCIGTIGADGCCRECGRAFEGDLPSGFQDTQSNPEDTPIHGVETDHRDKLGADDATSDDEGPEAHPDDAWARRTLCIDESCIGVVDETTGCCKECSKPYTKT